MKKDDVASERVLVIIPIGGHHPDCPVGKALKARASGPVQVATEKYRENYTNIFGAQQEMGQA